MRSCSRTLRKGFDVHKTTLKLWFRAYHSMRTTTRNQSKFTPKCRREGFGAANTLGGCSETSWRRLGGAPGAFPGDLGVARAAQERLRPSQERSWEHPGALLRVPGRALTVPGTSLKRPGSPKSTLMASKSNFRSIFGGFFVNSGRFLLWFTQFFDVSRSYVERSCDRRRHAFGVTKKIARTTPSV